MQILNLTSESLDSRGLEQGLRIMPWGCSHPEPGAGDVRGRMQLTGLLEGRDHRHLS